MESIIDLLTNDTNHRFLNTTAVNTDRSMTTRDMFVEKVEAYIAFKIARSSPLTAFLYWCHSVLREIRYHFL